MMKALAKRQVELQDSFASKCSFALLNENANLHRYRVAVLFFLFIYKDLRSLTFQEKTKPCIFIQGLRFK